ncbi:DegV family protein [Cellulomonas phragmiteti]|uniref:DegV domain-containing protein n=1 Tax=Cellulomonas phragmiteti TaxID=478780 RepID=A0ABQ4DKJ7_9CELL|nr:DegV family protein [Cellulomonas phragmiteti]GIG39887.1 DegV domain-containing protein [Cellulomonas phragmiteti]
MPTPRVAVVTDSTCAVPPALARDAGLHVVPLDVSIDGAWYAEGVDVTPDQLLRALERGAKVTTSQPPPSAFAAAYERAAAAGAHEIVSVHLSGEMSGTVRSARTAATVSPVPVRVVDSRTAALGLGFAALAAARYAATPLDPAPGDPADVEDGVGGAVRRWVTRAVHRGAAAPVWPDAAQVAGVAAAAAESSRVWFLVDSLEHLRRGGRLGTAAAALGTVLGLRPILAVQDGRLVVGEKVRTRRAARERLEQLALAELADRPSARVAVHHVGPPDVAAELAAHLAAATGVRPADVLVADAGAVLAAHVGPGLLAVVVADGEPAAPAPHDDEAAAPGRR